MRVALVHMRHAATGGTERYLDQVARALAERGHDVAIVCRTHEAAPHAAVRFVVLRPAALGGAARMRSFARAVERHVAAERYELVFALGRTWSHDVIRLGGGCHATYLERAHRWTLRPWERWIGWGGGKHRAALAIERRALAPGAYRAVIANSELVRRDAMARFAIPPERIHVIHNAVDLERFHPRQRAAGGAALRASLAFSAEDMVLLFLGTGYGRKGLDRLLAAFPAVLRARPSARLLVAGYDSDAASYERRARALGISAAARFLGGRRDAELCYAAADLYALPTRYDPFANTTLEALASGLPVITSATNGGAELITEGVEGAVIAGEDGSAELERALLAWLDRARLEAARGSARARAERCGERDTMARTVALLERVARE